MLNEVYGSINYFLVATSGEIIYHNQEIVKQSKTEVM